MAPVLHSPDVLGSPGAGADGACAEAGIFVENKTSRFPQIMCIYKKNQKIYHVSDPVIIAIAAVGTIIR